MKSDTIKTPFSATVRGRIQCRAALGSLSEHINDADFIMLFVNEGATSPAIMMTAAAPWCSASS